MNELKAIIQVQAPGVQQAFNGVAAGAQKAQSSLQKLTPATNGANQAMFNFGRVVQDAPFGILGIANNIDPLLSSFQQLKTQTGSTKAAFSALGSSLLGPAGLAIGVSAVTSLLIVFGDKIFGSGKKAKQAADAAKEFKDAVSGIFDSAAQEAAQVAGLVGVLNNEVESRERKIGALKELKRINREAFNDLRVESGLVVGLDAAYKTYLANLNTVIAVKVKQLQLEKSIRRTLELEGKTMTQSEKDAVELLKSINKQSGVNAAELPLNQKRIALQTSEANNEYKNQKQLLKEIAELSKGIKVTVPEVNTESLKETAEEIKSFARDDIPVEILVSEFRLERQAKAKLLKDLEELFKTLGGFQKQGTIARQINEEVNAALAAKDEFMKKAEELGKGIGDGVGKGFGQVFSERMRAAAGKIIASTNDWKEAQQQLNLEFVRFAVEAKSLEALVGNFNVFIDSILEGQNVFQAFGDFVKNTIKQIIAELLKAIAISALLSLISGGTAKGGFSFMQALGKTFGGGIANPGSMFGGMRAMPININVNGQLRGQDIFLSNSRASQSNFLTFG